ncbi:MAG TPA: OmpA family protein [Candidatus Polarisedimenticolia bacterium]|nr:OmpA family protein [Candidatus Polarisedimenticolia bacterium]
MRQKLATLLAVLLLAGTPLLAWGEDSDRDGVRDRKDQCADTPTGARVDKAGCPLDADSDGVPNGIDQCGRTPSGFPVDREGCPIDSDRDKVADGEDSCAGTPAGARVDARGCHSDSDGDMVLDGLDRCEGTPHGHRVEQHGCPVDSDHDGVNDALDQCADSRPAETVDTNGCRVKASPIFTEANQRVKLEGVTFEKNKIELAPESAGVMMNAAAALKDWPETRVEIAVHTDRAGSASVNRELSQRRADYLRQYLITLGVEEARLKAKGYGESKRYNERTVELVALSPETVASR